MSLKTYHCRWKRNTDGSLVVDGSSDKPVLQFVAVQRKDNGFWALPGVSISSRYVRLRCVWFILLSIITN